MKTNSNIAEKVKSTFESIDHIQDIKISPFFKDKTMRKLFDAEVEEEKILFSWFAPKLQLATLICIIILNSVAFIQLKSTTYDSNISNFAENYSLFTNSETSILN
tara:strand:+ start:546 stop:860 length:315 start_codon:yes stop_codon:yes gene_type:complete